MGRTALLVIDVQADFCPGGALAVPDGDSIVPVANALMGEFDFVVLTQDWHPRGHKSFADCHPGRLPFETIELGYGPQTLWPVHCVAGSPGARFHPALDTTRASLIVRKGFRPEIDSYSAFFENDHETPTGLGGALREMEVERVALVGLATDYCVRFSALDAARLGLSVEVIGAGCRAIDVGGSLEQALGEMRAAGVVVRSV